MWHRWTRNNEWCSCGSLRRSSSKVFERPRLGNDHAIARAKLLASAALRAAFEFSDFSTGRLDEEPTELEGD